MPTIAIAAQVLSIPCATPAMIVVAGPVTLCSAIHFVGLNSAAV